MKTSTYRPQLLTIASLNDDTVTTFNAKRYFDGQSNIHDIVYTDVPDARLLFESDLLYNTESLYKLVQVLTLSIRNKRIAFQRTGRSEDILDYNDDYDDVVGNAYTRILGQWNVVYEMSMDWDTFLSLAYRTTAQLYDATIYRLHRSLRDVSIDDVNDDDGHSINTWEAFLKDDEKLAVQLSKNMDTMELRTIPEMQWTDATVERLQKYLNESELTFIMRHFEDAKKIESGSHLSSIMLKLSRLIGKVNKADGRQLAIDMHIRRQELRFINREARKVELNSKARERKEATKTDVNTVVLPTKEALEKAKAERLEADKKADALIREAHAKREAERNASKW
jgi:hypothetical protein